jgi:hypothetical protein
MFIRDKPIFSAERTLHKDHNRKGSVEKILVVESQGAWRQYELIGDKPPVDSDLELSCDSRQRGRPTLTNPQLCDSNKNLVLGPQIGAWHQDRLAKSPSIVT